MLAYLLLGVAQIAGLVLIVLGVPGGWLQLAALWAYAWWTEFVTVSLVPLVVLLALASVAELLIALAGRPTPDRAAARKVGIAGMVGGLVGAAFGLRFPLLGSIAGTFFGACLGATLAGWRAAGTQRSSERFARIARAALRTTVGIAIAALTFVLLPR